ncbi:hypothetical protein QM012_004376 [Aureobasidium pullulans]|uniref:4'-phosphopantetheinyl transferase domain-containing protein n=1 Tax=Aureobasidium pullulans TaxID=5580 RepID=A0ABR0TT16_AURPU
MPPRPFPQSLSIGTDICRYTRFLKYFPKHQHPQNTTTAISSQTLLFKLFDKVFLPSEQREFWRRFQAPTATSRRLVPSSGSGSAPYQQHWDEQRAEKAARYIGGRWAAKEAVIKAFSSERRLMLRDVEIRSNLITKQPLAVVLDQASKPRYQSAEEVYADLTRRWQLSKELAKQLGEGAAGAALDKESRNIEEFTSRQHTAEANKHLVQQEGPNNEQERQTTPSSAAAAATATPRILPEKGLLNLNAVTQLLEHESQPSSSSSSTSPAEEQQNEPKQKPATVAEKSQSKRHQQLEEEIKRLRETERAEKDDEWENLQGQIVQVSISHDGKYCVATALAAV